MSQLCTVFVSNSSRCNIPPSQGEQGQTIDAPFMAVKTNHRAQCLESNEATREATGASIHASNHSHVYLQGYMPLNIPRLGALCQKSFHAKEQELTKANKPFDCTHGTCKASHWDAMSKGCRCARLSVCSSTVLARARWLNRTCAGRRAACRAGGST